MNNFRKNQIFSFLRYTGDALVFTFLIRFFNSLNFNDLMTGTLLASIPLMAIIGNLTIGILSKSVKRNLLLMKILMPIETLGICLIGFFSNFYIVLSLSVMINFCNSSFYSLLDSTSSSIATNCKKNYASIRIFGSFAYLFGSLSGGFFIKWIDYSFVFLIGGGVYILGYLILLLLDKTQFSAEKTDEAKKGVAKELLHNKSFMLYIGFYVLILSMSHVTDNFFAIYAEAKGIDNSHYGIIFASMILAEVIVMLIVLKLKPKRNKLMLLIAGGFLLLRTMLLAFNPPKFYLYFIPTLRGIGWGMLLSVHLNTLKTIVKDKNLTKAIISLTVLLQVFNTLFNQFGPSFITHSNYQVFFWTLLGVGLLGYAFLIVNKLNLKCSAFEEESLR